MNDKLKEKITQNFKNFQDTIHKRQTQNPKWLLNHSKHPYIPDYFNFSNYGNSRLQKLINRLLSPMPKLWNRFITPHITKHTLDSLKTRYSPIWKSHPHLEEPFLSHIKHLLKSHPKALKKATFTELFQFISESLHELATHIKKPDTFKEVKTHHNKSFIPLYHQLREELPEHPKKTDLLLYLVTRANWLDIMEPSMTRFETLFFEEVNNLLDDEEDLHFQITQNPHFHSQKFTHWLRGAPKTILYELDNVGEHLLDLLLIEDALKHGHTLYLSAKKAPTLNDITLSELNTQLQTPDFAHLTPYLGKTLHTLDNGSKSTGKQHFKVSQRYKAAYKAADFLIIKGQGNFGCMPMGQKRARKFHPYPYKKPMFYLMGVKAPIIHQSLSTIFSKPNHPPLGSFFAYYFNPKDPTTWPK